MAKHCLHCNRKIGLFKAPIDQVYCSHDCQSSAREELASARREAEENTRVRERLEAEAAALHAAESGVVMRPRVDGPLACPKCGEAWRFAQGGGTMGRSAGSCVHCSFVADFIAIDECQHCRCPSLVVYSEDDARCPRCKSRPRRRRQIA